MVARGGFEYRGDHVVCPVLGVMRWRADPWGLGFWELYPPMARGFLHLLAIMDSHSRRVLAGRLSNTLGADFAVDALAEVLEQGKPEVFTTDQGSRFISQEPIRSYRSTG